MLSQELLNNRDKINSRLNELFPEDKNILTQAIRYSLLSSGKRLRGLMFMESERICGKKTHSLDVACAIEMLHCYSLLHDDLPCMDDDDFRRGLPSCHKKFNESTAVLAGDALLTRAFEVIANANNLSYKKKSILISILSSSSGYTGICLGQSRDLKNELNCEDSDYTNKLKTGCLFSATTQMGCISAGKYDEKLLKISSEFGFTFGRAFQLKDDIDDGDYLNLEAHKKNLNYNISRAKEILSKEYSKDKIFNLLEILKFCELNDNR